MLKTVKQVKIIFFDYFQFIYFTIGSNNNAERPVVQRRLGPVDHDRPRAAQIRRRQFNPVHGYNAGVQNNDDDDAGK